MNHTEIIRKCMVIHAGWCGHLAPHEEFIQLLHAVKEILGEDKL